MNSRGGSNVLHAFIENMHPKHPVTLDVLHTLFSEYGPVLKILIWDENGRTQVLIKYPDVQTAIAAKETLEGYSIHEGGICKLRVFYYARIDFSVEVSGRGRDYTTLISQPSFFGQEPRPNSQPPNVQSDDARSPHSFASKLVQKVNLPPEDDGEDSCMF